MTNEHSLTLETLPHLNEMFGTFHDALIHQVNLKLFGTSKAERTAELILGATRWDIQANQYHDRWVNLHLKLLSVEEIHINQPLNLTIAVVYKGQIIADNSFVAVDFSYYDDISLPSSIPINYTEFLKTIPSKRTNLYISAKTCTWWIVPYSKNTE